MIARATAATTARKPASTGKPYHHGELRQALIDATRQLVVERGAEHFTLADACRCAGVTTAAPYRHFRDKEEILAEVVAQGFDWMSQREREAAAPFAPGTIERIVAIGRDYVAFASEETALFRLMFGQNPKLRHEEKVEECGKACFAFVIDEVASYIASRGRPGDPVMTAVQLWTLVHGVACLTIEDAYAKVAPEIDLDAMIADAARKIL